MCRAYAHDCVNELPAAGPLSMARPTTIVSDDRRADSRIEDSMTSMRQMMQRIQRVLASVSSSFGRVALFRSVTLPISVSFGCAGAAVALDFAADDVAVVAHT